MYCPSRLVDSAASGSGTTPGGKQTTAASADEPLQSQRIASSSIASWGDAALQDRAARLPLTGVCPGSGYELTCLLINFLGVQFIRFAKRSVRAAVSVVRLDCFIPGLRQIADYKIELNEVAFCERTQHFQRTAPNNIEQIVLPCNFEQPLCVTRRRELIPGGGLPKYIQERLWSEKPHGLDAWIYVLNPNSL